MKASLRALLANVIDYAGLFPPAKLPLDEAIRNYARYRTEPESWMLGRFICPATRLAELTPFAEELFTAESPLRLSTLGRNAETVPESLESLKADIEDIATLEKRLGERVVVDTYEVRTPPETLAEREFKWLFLILAGIQLRELRQARLFPFYEAEMTNGWPGLLDEWSAAFAELQELASTEFERFEVGSPAAGLKLRCGGPDAAAFPPVELVAATIVACRNGGVPLKFTAGLHHPVRHFDPGVQIHMHGFLNAFGAGVLAHAKNLSEEQVREIVEDQDPYNFVFDDEHFRWKDTRLTVREIGAARQRAVISFGSCSFDEPRDDLRALGLL